MIIKNDFNVVDYISLVNSIVNEFFNEDGEYVPHFGRLNIMRLFYNECVIESKFDLPHDFENALLLDALVSDDEFIAAFNEAIKGDGKIRLDFANAYTEAMEIIDYKKNSLNSIVDTLKTAINNFAEKMSPVLSEDVISKFSEIADNIAKGNISAESFVKAYGESKRIEDITNKG